MKLNVIIPCYNESPVIIEAAKEISKELEYIKMASKISDYEIIFIDDGSKDNTWDLIKKISGQHIHGIKLSRNVGHQNALWAGYEYSQNKCDMVISIDADLQQESSVERCMYRSWKHLANHIFVIIAVGKKNINRF